MRATKKLRAKKKTKTVLTCLWIRRAFNMAGRARRRENTTTLFERNKTMKKKTEAPKESKQETSNDKFDFPVIHNLFKFDAMTVELEKFKTPPTIKTPTERPKFPELVKVNDICEEREFCSVGKYIEAFLKQAKKQNFAQKVYDAVMKATNGNKASADSRVYIIKQDLKAMAAFVKLCKALNKNHKLVTEYGVKMTLWKIANKKPVSKEERFLAELFGDIEPKTFNENKTVKKQKKTAEPAAVKTSTLR